MTTKTWVRIVRGEDRTTALRQAVGDGLRAVITPGDTVVLKPNLNGADIRGAQIAVPLASIAATCQMLREAGASEIFVVEDLSKHCPTLRLFEESGLAPLEDMPGVHLAALEEGTFVEVHPQGGLLRRSFHLAELPLRANKVISLTTLKTHHQVGATVSLKNLYAFFPNEEKSLWHRIDLDKAIVDLNLVRTADFTIVDAFVAHEGLGPRRGKPVPMGLMFAGPDPVAADTIGAMLMGIDPAGIRHIAWAAARGLGTNRLDEIAVEGLPVRAVARPFQTNLGHLNELLAGQAAVLAGANCNGCIGATVTAMHIGYFRFGHKPSDFAGLKVCIGDVAGITDDARTLWVSDHVRSPVPPERFVPGDPPTVTAVWQAVCRLMGLGDGSRSWF